MGRISVGGVGGWSSFQAKAQSLIIENAAHKGIMGDKLVKEGRCRNMEDFECQAQIGNVVRDKHTFFLNTLALQLSQKPQAAEYLRVIWFTHS